MEITDKQKQRIEQIAKNYGLRLVLLFGSRVSGPLNRESDFDVAYLAKKKLSFDQGNRLNYEFVNVFGHERERVDTVDLKEAPPLLAKMIFDQHQILFCEDREIYYNYEIYAYKKFIEAKPLFELREYLLNKRLN